MPNEERLVLDQMPVPDGVLELIAYRERGSIWVGIQRKHGQPLGAIGLGTGSYEHQIEATAMIDREFAVAFGGVAPGIERAEVRNEEGETFEASILSLPDALDTDYRAVWGFAERCRESCDIVGYDVQGRMYDPSDPRVYGPEPSTEDRLEAIRAHAHRSMRYYATAYLRETGENKRRIETYMGMAADYLALLEGPALDDRSALGRRDRIVRRYLEEAKSDPWEPGTCSFCGQRPVAAWLEGPTFRPYVRRSADVRAGEAWLACQTCLSLVESNDRDELARRGARRLRASPAEHTVRIARETQDEEFWSKRDPR
jgi:hypothetical protein